MRNYTDKIVETERLRIYMRIGPLRKVKWHFREQKISLKIPVETVPLLLDFFTYIFLFWLTKFGRTNTRFSNIKISKDMNIPGCKSLQYSPGFGVAAGGGGFGLFPNVVSAVELTPNNMMNTVKSIVKLPHCVNRLSGSIFSFK